ncbi:MAG: ferrochelatase [Caldilineaceae bacterium]|nr:ferrochelatase [Caldilineaceae bacterium]MCB9156228.1 ferrochelatase [Caldilineaceae bacterium]
MPQSTPYDALLLLSFGGPEGMDEVMPFLENVLRGRNVPPARMMEVAHHYEQFNGVSPINAQNRALIAALETELAAHNIELPIYFGNRNWHPLLTDTMQQMVDDGVQRVLTFFTSIYSSYSGCRQYRENLYGAAQSLTRGQAPHFDKIRMAYNHPLFIEANAVRIQDALAHIPAARRNAAQLVFTAHSIPIAMAQNCQYVEQLMETGRLVAEVVKHPHWQLVYQSRSGPPTVPWLEPDICDHLQALHEQGVQDVVIAPIGFISDHMEVIFDLDTEARQLCDALGLNMVRAATVGTHPAFVQMLRELVEERINPNAERRAMGRLPASHDLCPADCCLSGRPGPAQPAMAQRAP